MILTKNMNMKTNLETPQYVEANFITYSITETLNLYFRISNLFHIEIYEYLFVNIFDISSLFNICTQTN